MIYQFVKDTVLFIPKKLTAINNAADKIVGIIDKTGKTYIYMTKVTVIDIGFIGVAKEIVDFFKAV